MTKVVNRYCLQSITTTYKGPTNAKAAKIVAKASRGSKITLEYSYLLSPEQNHTKAAIKLCEKLGWNYDLAMGTLDDSSNVYVMVEKGN